MVVVSAAAAVAGNEMRGSELGRVLRLKVCLARPDWDRCWETYPAQTPPPVRQSLAEAQTDLPVGMSPRRSVNHPGNPGLGRFQYCVN